MGLRLLVLLFFLALSNSCSKKETLFVKMSEKHTNISFSNTLKNSPELNILNYLYYYNGAGVVIADFNNDDQLDLFFTGNQVQDELYINQGDFKFLKSKQTFHGTIEGSWSTGATYVDLNNDGLLDLYICKASGYRTLKGRNLLYINQGSDENGLPSFKEEASKYGLDFSGMSTHAAFFDFDLDGDLDMYLMNHSVHPNRNYGRGQLRDGYHPTYGDVLYQNNEGFFEDISENAGIFQGKIGYGLGLSIGDINGDNYPDIYVGNDFFENDYLYLNQKDGTFKEIISKNPDLLGHTSHFSMGNTIADLNNDGLQDIISLDMLPENLQTYKTSGLEYGYPIYRQYLNKGYSPQYMQNTLHMNLDGNRFSEVGYISGISATEWSWGTLAADFDNDGLKDIFISNGIVGATNDMDYMNFIANEDIQRRIDNGMSQDDLPLVKEIPQKKVPNYFFKNQGNLNFENISSRWMEVGPTYSNGCAYGDLDNDGDLDLVINNINEPITLLKNKSSENHALTLKFQGPLNNRYGIGAKVKLYGKRTQTLENFPYQGYLSTSAPQMHFGLQKDSIIDSLTVQWPDGKIETLTNLKSNQTLSLNYNNAHSEKQPKFQKKGTFISKDSIIPFYHKENISVDFDREPLIPFAGSNEGPSIAVGDINNDGFEDVFVGGAKKQSSQLFVQLANGIFNIVQNELFERSAMAEATTSTFLDANNDGWLDLIVGYGGNEFSAGKNIRPRLYLNKEGTFSEFNAFEPSIEGNFSSIEPADLDKDGDLDLVIASDQLPGNFGKTPKSYILFNDGNGHFKEVTQQFAPQFEFLGNLKSTQVVDINSDGKNDLIAIGYWTSISIFLNNGEKLELQEKNGLTNTKGWWNNAEIADFDNDGDFDLICGNWGLNSKFKASKEKPITLYRNDFDGNGSVEPLVTYYHKDTETPFSSKDELVKQLPILNKEFLSYSKFAAASIEELFGEDKLSSAERKEVYELETSYFENTGKGNFKKKTLPRFAQVSQIRKIISADVNNDGFLDVILMGNNYHISTQLGRMDALHGLVLYNDGKGNFDKNLEHLTVDGQVNDIKKLTINNSPGYIIGRNNNTPVFVTKRDSL